MKICLVFLSGGKKGSIDCLIEGPVTLGTGRKNDIKFGRATDRKISLDHAVITDDRGDIYISDSRSRSGTFVNGEKITKRTLLKDWDVR